MEIPFYYSFTDFQSNYDSDFEKWKQKLTDGTEKIYLRKLLQHYETKIDTVYYETKDIEFIVSYNDEILGEHTTYISIKDLCNELDCRVFNFVVDDPDNLNDIYDEFTEHEGHYRFFAENSLFYVAVEYNDIYNGILTTSEKKSRFSNSDYLYNGSNFRLFERFVNFYTVSDFELNEYIATNEYSIGQFLWFDSAKYENYKISIIRIYEWIKNRLENPENDVIPPPTEPAPEPHLKETGRKNIPYKLALLRELGILDKLNVQYSDNKEQLYRILDYLTGGNTKGYYLSMYGDNYTGKDRVTTAHTADLRQKGLI